MKPRTRAIVPPEGAGMPVEEITSGWNVIRSFDVEPAEYEAAVADLSHCPKAIVHGPEAEKLGEMGEGNALRTEKGFACRLIPQEAMVFDVSGPSAKPDWPNGLYTDLTDALALFALWGPKCQEVVQRLVAVDVERPDSADPFYLVTSCHGIGLHLINAKGPAPTYFLACARSQGQGLYDMCLHSGHFVGLRPVGTDAFAEWWGQV